MADQVQLTPEQQAALKAFAEKYPNFDYRMASAANMGNALAHNLETIKDPTARAYMMADFAQLRKTLEPAMKGYHFTEGGDIEKNMAWWKQALLAAGVVGGPLVAGALLPAAATAPAGGVLPATSTVGATGSLAPGLAPGLNLAAGTTTAGVTTGTGIGTATGGSVLDKIGKFGKGKWGDILKGGAEAVGAATDAAGKNRVSRDELNMEADRNFENALMGREGAEQKERNTALDNVYRNSWYQNRTPGPNNMRGVPAVSPDFMATLGTLSQQGQTMLNQDPRYTMNVVDPLKKYVPKDPSLMEKIGTYAGPILSIAGLFGGK